MDETTVRSFDAGALLIGAWFALVGVIGMIAGADSTTDALPLVFPLTLVLVGIGLLLPPRRRAPQDPDEPAAEPELGAGPSQ